MARARQSALWDAASALLAMLHNTNCSRTTQMKSPDNFHPFRQKPQRPRLGPAESIDALLAVFTAGSKIQSASGEERE
jgi:hypothetical protein